MNNASDWAVASQQHCLGLLKVASFSLEESAPLLRAAAVTRLALKPFPKKLQKHTHGVI